MPIYEYHCDDCSRAFETLVRSGEDDQVQCPSCGGLKVSRELSVFASRAAHNAVEANGGPALRGGACCGGSCGCH